jgi:hypothetical protein
MTSRSSISSGCTTGTDAFGIRPRGTGTPARSCFPSTQRLRAAAGHAVSFWNWHSLVVEQSLESDDASYLAASLLVVAAGR